MRLDFLIKKKKTVDNKSKEMSLHVCVLYEMSTTGIKKKKKYNNVTSASMYTTGHRDCSTYMCIKCRKYGGYMQYMCVKFYKQFGKLLVKFYTHMRVNLC